MSKEEIIKQKRMKALAFLAHICPTRAEWNGQEVVIMTEVAYNKLIKILSNPKKD